MDLLPRIEIDGASKTIGNSVVLDQIQLTVKPGEMIGLQGVNAAAANFRSHISYKGPCPN